MAPDPRGNFTCCATIVSAAVAGENCASVAGVSCESCCEDDASHGQVLVRLRGAGPLVLISISIVCCKSCSMYLCVVVRRRLVGLSDDIVRGSSPQANALMFSG